MTVQYLKTREWDFITFWDQEPLSLLVAWSYLMLQVNTINSNKMETKIPFEVILFDFHNMLISQQANKNKNPGTYWFIFKWGMKKILWDLNTKRSV